LKAISSWAREESIASSSGVRPEHAIERDAGAWRIRAMRSRASGARQRERQRARLAGHAYHQRLVAVTLECGQVTLPGRQLDVGGRGRERRVVDQHARARRHGPTR
jgi:hypothetical protein